MQKIILFIEPNDRAFYTPVKIGNLFMNRFAIDEDASAEFLNIFELCKRLSSHKRHEEAPNDKGTDN